MPGSSDSLKSMFNKSAIVIQKDKVKKNNVSIIKAFTIFLKSIFLEYAIKKNISRKLSFNDAYILGNSTNSLTY